MTVCCWNSDAQNALHSHGVAAVAPIVEKAAGAVPFAVVEGGGMNIILAMEICLEARELDTFRFLRIAFGFCDLAYHT